MQAMQTGSGVIKQFALFAPPPPSAADVDLHAVSRPARVFTGDFYYTHRHRDRLWLALGDVAGKGLPAAVFMAMIQEELEHRIGSCSRRGCDPSATMTRLHEFLRPVLPSNRFATAVIGYLADDGRFVIANAGHCPPIIVRADGTTELVASTGPVVGILPRAQWQSSTRQLQRGDALVLYSDGVIEGPGEIRRRRTAAHRGTYVAQCDRACRGDRRGGERAYGRFDGGCRAAVISPQRPSPASRGEGR